ncbi:MAG: hypothetical protein ACYCSQ_00160 [bacterium]
MDAQKIYETLESFFNLYTDSENLPYNKDVLMQSEIKFYILSKITQKAFNYPNLLNLKFETEKDLNTFEKAFYGQIKREFLNLISAVKKYNPIAKNKIEVILEKAIIAYIDLRGVYTASLNQKVNQDGKTTELIDLIPAYQWETYEETNSELFDDIGDKNFRVKKPYQKREKENGSLQPVFAF